MARLIAMRLRARAKVARRTRRLNHRSRHALRDPPHHHPLNRPPRPARASSTRGPRVDEQRRRLAALHREDIDPNTAPTLAAAVKLAVREKCVFIRFDSDGPLVDELPTYDW